MGYTGKNKLYVAALEAVPTTSIAVWQAFLATLPGQPARVVTDAGIQATGRGVALVHRHRDAALRVTSAHRPQPARRAAQSPPGRHRPHPRGCLVAADAALTGAASTHNAPSARSKSAGALDPLVRAQAATRPPTGPHSTGPLEEFFHTLNQTIGDRAARMTNKRRADALLTLLAAHRNGWVEEHHWGEIIRAHLIKRRGIAPPHKNTSHPTTTKPAPKPEPRTHPKRAASTLSDTYVRFRSPGADISQDP